MFRNYVRIMFRSMIKNKTYSFLNIAGLAIGMTCVILILFWINNELSFDRFHKNAGQIYKILTLDKRLSREEISDTTPGPLAQALKDDVPEIVSATRFNMLDEIVIQTKDDHEQTNRSFVENRIAFADPDFLAMFSFPLVMGNIQTALTDPYSIVLSKEMAVKYFGSKNPLGKMLHLVNKCDVQVTGVLADIPANSHIQFDFILPFEILLNVEGFGQTWTKEWGMCGVRSFVLLEKNADEKDVNKKIAGYLPARGRENSVLELQSLTKIYLHSSYRNSIGINGKIEYVYLFFATALFILLIACFNFINLTTARSMARAKEIGIRKVVGANKTKIVIQFLGEAFFYSFIACVIAVILAEILLPMFNNFTDKDISLFQFNKSHLFILTGVILFSSLLSGAYPAWIFSTFQPVMVLKSTKISQSNLINIRKFLVISQFALSIISIISLVTIHNQIHYIRHKDLGYDRENVIRIPLTGYGQNEMLVKNDILQHSHVISASFLSQTKTDEGFTFSQIDWEGKDPDIEYSFNLEIVDFDYVNTFQVKMKEGRFFSGEFAADEKEAVIINETAAQYMNLKSPLDTRISIMGENCNIIGIVKDFHFQPLQTQIGPLVLRIMPGWYTCLYIRIQSNDIQETLAYFKKVHEKYNPAFPFSYEFLDKEFEQQFVTQQRIEKALIYFMILAILISCLGLFGLAAFSAERRTKEIGIRKVMGASVPAIITMFVKDFGKWVLLANIIAWPIAYLVMDKWLQYFAYRIDMTIWPFLGAGLVALLISLATVSWQAILVATANPVEALRYE